MLIITLGALHVMREGDGGVRFTIPTMHSTTILTIDEAKTLRDELTKHLRTRRTKPEYER